MTTKRELVNQIQELADYHLGHKGLNFDNYMRMSKPELELRLSKAQEMHNFDIQIKDIYDTWTSEQLLMAGIFPLNVEPKLRIAHEKLNVLGRLASELWFKV